MPHNLTQLLAATKTTYLLPKFLKFRRKIDGLKGMKEMLKEVRDSLIVPPILPIFSIIRIRLEAVPTARFH